MTSAELIAQLQELDPEGTLEVMAPSGPIYFAQRLPAYYDGPLEVLIHDEDLKGTRYSIIGYKYTRLGDKITLQTVDLHDAMGDNPDIPVILEGYSEKNRAYMEAKIRRMRADANEEVHF